MNQPWLIVLDPLPGQSGTRSCPGKTARAARGRGTGQLAKPVLGQRLRRFGFDELQNCKVRGTLSQSVSSEPDDASTAIAFLALPQLAPKINAHIVSLIPSFIGIAHGVKRGQDEPGRNKQSGPKSAFGSDLDEIDEWFDVGRYIN